MDKDAVPTIYELNRVVFGVNSSPFQAQFVAQKHAEKNKERSPRAAEVILKSTYMDDSMDSVEDEKEGIELYEQLSDLWESAGMHARKWLSNSTAVLERFPEEDRVVEIDLDKGSIPAMKTLGVLWKAGEDTFTFNINPPDEGFHLTKRNFLRKIATMFDPLGFLGPFCIRAKILLQKTWMAGIDWDEELPEDLAAMAWKWFSELTQLKQVNVPRCLRTDEIVISEDLHVFVDASQDACGAGAYIRCEYQSGLVTCRLVASKTRVAPLIAVSIPRLELMAAILGLKLAEVIARVMDKKMQDTVFWSDSMNVLWWIRGCSRQYKPFVANRIGEIHRLTNPEQWRYAPTKRNPADLVTRSISASELCQSDIWWNGPQFLKENESDWPENMVEKVQATKEESSSCQQRSSMKVTFHTQKNTDLTVPSDEDNSPTWRLNPERFSSWAKLKRIHGLVIRFVDNCRLPKSERSTGELLTEEIADAEVRIIKQEQKKSYHAEYAALKNEKRLPNNSKLLSLNPKLDEDGLMRSDSRLINAEYLAYDVRYPVILPRKNHVTKLIVKHYHEEGRHVIGTNQLLSNLAAHYWIVSGREEVREWEKECMECRRRKAKAATQIMAPLPDFRVRKPLHAFARTGVDYAGPFITTQGRGKRRQKRYLCLFTCLTTRAVHLEMAYGLDTDSFLNAFYRMVNRRGLPTEMISDNGGNCVAGNKELRELVKKIDQDKVVGLTANKGIKWKFNPPLSPHFGGVFETMIKAAKRAINAILADVAITDEELTTGAEALINSRPLTYQSDDPRDDLPLTPNHFLHGQVGGQFAPQSVDETDFSPRKRWRRLQELVRHFWHRWLREWLPGLGSRKKWLRPQRDVKVGDVVLVISPDTTRGHWPLGRVIEAFPGKDNHVRVVKLQVGRSVITRSLSKICPLDLVINNSDKYSAV